MVEPKSNNPITGEVPNSNHPITGGVLVLAVTTICIIATLILVIIGVAISILIVHVMRNDKN